MMLISIFDLTLPLTNPVLKFLLILVIILFAPLILNKFKIPHLLGLIIAGAVIGPYGFLLMERDSSIILSGTAGLLYIMFLAGLEINIDDFKKNSQKSLVFGLYTFLIPMVLGIVSGIFVLGFSIPTSILLASMFASHTLIAYPLISNMGVSKNTAVNITVGGTLITDTLALLVLAIVVGTVSGEVNLSFWIRLLVSLIAFGLVVLFVFPIISRWFFKRYNDNVSQYIFVLIMVFLGAVLAETAGVEPIIGAFLAGLALNRLIPHTSPLMNRIEFVGNAIFIPFFLIGVGMLIDYRAFIEDWYTLKVAAIMTIVATTAKFVAAWLTQKTYNFSIDERRLIFGLSNAQAAATLAAVLVGYNIILGETDAGEPIRLLNENVLNGTILMILITCTIASFVAQKGARNIAFLDAAEIPHDESELPERILISINNPDSTDELVNLGITIKSKKATGDIYALSVINNDSTDQSADKKAKKILTKAAITAASTDHFLHELLRYDLNIGNGITSVVKEHKISDLILGLHMNRGISDSFLGNLTEGILSKCNVTTLIYKPVQPFTTIKRHFVIVPKGAEQEIGFAFWLIKVWNIARNTGIKLVFYATKETLSLIEEIQEEHPVACEFVLFEEWGEFLILARDLKRDDNLIIVLSRKDKSSYNEEMESIPSYLNKYFKEHSFILVYPMQTGVTDNSVINFKDPTIPETIEKLDEMRKTIGKIFKRK
ncbi:cation:proton antiporter [Echinicola sp. CAU 1574]|uniref:Cation:proton antiporter n=1 Tax=Echinicola arenosa TaxID=2774144 RepID=A0ABR9AFF2_9BACT|nr:cation:proton antiporter [Echinicola arenosa]MBD8487451.1 cation:proton antiporter [Echinicola arenosa]